jgi:hypothetical protein
VASFLAAIDNLRPRFVLMENVSGMATTVKTVGYFYYLIVTELSLQEPHIFPFKFMALYKSYLNLCL